MVTSFKGTAIHLEERQWYNQNSDFIQTIIHGVGVSPTEEKFV
jgi:hypothetical protein